MDNGSFKHKKDAIIKECQQASFRRLRCDLQHFALERVPGIQHKKIVGLGKHICGAAFDFSLRALLRLRESTSVLEGAVLATCCHHRCTFETLCNQEFFINHDISMGEFDSLLTKMSSWGTSFNLDVENANIFFEDAVFNFSANEKLQIGLKCKLLIDYSRLLYLQQLGFKTRLLHYIDSKVTRENTLLIFHKST